MLAAATAVAGGVHTMLSLSTGYGPQPLVDWILIALGLFWVFMWLHADQREFGYRRSPWMNVGIVLLSVVFVPVYLARTRPAGRKLASVGWFLLVLLGWFGLSILGSLIGYFVFADSHTYFRVVPN